MSSDARSALGSLVLPIYLPTAVYSVGMAALLPFIPLLAMRLGYTAAQASLLVTVAAMVRVIGPIPIGRLLLRVSERATLIAGAVAAVATGTAGFGVVVLGSRAGPGPGPAIAYAICIVVLQAAGLLWQLGRQAYLAEELPVAIRARGMSIFGGSLRVGHALGPFVAALVLVAFPTDSVFLIQAVCAAVALALVAAFVVPRRPDAAEAPDRPTDRPTDRDAADTGTDTDTDTGQVPSVRHRPRPLDRAAHRRALRGIVLIALGAAALMLARLNRNLVVPLRSEEIGLSDSTLSLVLGLASAVELAVFLPAGVLTDRYGRLAVLLPCMGLIGAGYLMLPLQESAGWFLFAVLVFGLGNGLGSGIVQTLAVDMTPDWQRVRYLSYWNTLVNTGWVAGPALVTAALAFAGVGAAAVATGAVALAGGAWMALMLPRWNRYALPRRPES